MTGLTNAKKAMYYGRLHDRLATHGWIQGYLYGSDGSSCLRGGIQRVTDSLSDQGEFEMDLATVLFEKSPLLLKPKFYEPCPGAIEVWNDRAFRRKKTVLKMLRQQQEKYAALAKEDRVAELQARVTELEGRVIPKLKARITELEAEVERLHGEVRFWKARRARVTAKELTSSSAVLADLDRQLDESMQELAELQ